MAVSCPACGAEEPEVVSFLELPYDSRSDEITVFVKRCRSCNHRYLAVYEESRRGVLGEDHWNYHDIECSEASWEEVARGIAACPNSRDYRCQCAIHRKLGVRDELGYWLGLDKLLGAEPEPAERKTSLMQHAHGVVAVAWSADGSEIASADLDGKLCVWDATSGALRATAAARNLRRLWWSDALRWLGHGGIRVLDRERGRSSLELKVEQASAAARSFDGRVVAVGTKRGEVAIFDVPTGACRARFQVLSSREGVAAIAWSPEGDRFACAGSAGEAVRCLDAGTGKLLWRRSHGSVYYSGSGDPFGFPDEEREAEVVDLAFSPDGRVLISAGEGQHVVLWSPDGDCIGKVPVNGWTQTTALAISPDGSLLAVVDGRGAARVARLAGEDDPEVLEISETELRAVAFSPDGRRLAVGAEDGRIHVVEHGIAPAARETEPQCADPKGDSVGQRAARAAGPIQPDEFRVVVLEADHSTSHADYADLEEARRHADDAASEAAPTEPLAWIFDSELRLVGRGRHYAARGGGAGESWHWELRGVPEASRPVGVVLVASADAAGGSDSWPAWLAGVAASPVRARPAGRAWSAAITGAGQRRFEVDFRVRERQQGWLTLTCSFDPAWLLQGDAPVRFAEALLSAALQQPWLVFGYFTTEPEHLENAWIERCVLAPLASGEESPVSALYRAVAITAHVVQPGEPALPEWTVLTETPNGIVVRAAAGVDRLRGYASGRAASTPRYVEIVLPHHVDGGRLLVYDRRAGEHAEVSRGAIPAGSRVWLGSYVRGPVGMFSSADGPVFFRGSHRYLLRRGHSRAELRQARGGYIFELWQGDELAHRERLGPLPVDASDASGNAAAHGFYADLAAALEDERFFARYGVDGRDAEGDLARATGVDRVGEYCAVFDHRTGRYLEVYRLLADEDRAWDFGDADDWTGYVRPARAGLLLDSLRAAYSEEQFEVSIRKARHWESGRADSGAALSHPPERAEAPSYIFTTPDERRFPERYRVLRADERLSEIAELGDLSGVVSARVADAFCDALRAACRGTELAVDRAWGASWSEVAVGYHGLGRDRTID